MTHSCRFSPLSAILLIGGLSVVAQTKLLFSQPILPSSESASIASITAPSSNIVQLVMQFGVPSLKEESLASGETEMVVTSPTTDHLVMNLLYKLPSYEYALQAHVESVRIVAEEGVGVLQNVVLKFHIEALNDAPIGLPAEQLPQAKSVKTTSDKEPFPKERVRWFYGGTMRGTPLTSLTVSPYTYFPATKTLRYVQKLTLELRLNTAEGTAQEFRVDLNEAELLRQVPRKRSAYKPSQLSIAGQALSFSEAMGVQQNVYGRLPVVPKYRFIVRKQGIYRLGFFEFQDAGFPTDFFTADPRTFRLFNKGKEVPILVKGEQDGRFNRDDYVEFIGEPHRLAFSDPARPEMYNDPYTDENVYYFYWEPALTPQNRGLRLVEIPAEPRGTTGVINLRNQSFRTTLHFEENRAIDRMNVVYDTFNTAGYRRTRNHSDMSDKFFWALVFSDRGASVSLEVPAPQANNFTDSIIIRAAFHGRNPAGEREPAYLANLFFSIGGDLFPVMRAEWGSRAEGLFRPTIIRSALSPGFHRFLGNVSALRIISGLTNVAVTVPYFYLNWIEITYRRLYRAVEDEIVFTTPPDARPGRYQFVISGFTTPDIDI
ncbi:MAG: hypothetical protein NZM05_06085, partial [Chloroherpetonaceae bacterium]|nr:hypothetical protein [Chloroherpetonaceae bacterium]